MSETLRQRVGTDWLPVVGDLRPWLRGSGEWYEYDTGTVFGLCNQASPATIEVLVMNAHEPGHGHGGAFLLALTEHYDSVVVWEVLSGDLRGMLTRRGFTRFTDTFTGAEGYRWRAAALRGADNQERSPDAD